ncbi:MAG: FISUMP domain-containing protein [Bacteroidota bacterium]
MKKILFILASLLFSFNIAHTQIVTTGLVAYYPFNGNANDASGNGYNGTIHGSTLTSDRFGNINSSYSFNGVNNYINITTSNGFSQFNNPQSIFSISAWFKTTAGFQSIFSNSSEDGWNSVCTDNNGFLKAHITDIYWSTSVGDISSNSVVNDGQWHFATFVFSNPIMKLYVDGVLKNTVNFVGSVLSSGNWPQGGVKIGVFYIPQNGYFNGCLDDIRIYNRAISQTEIDSLYHEGGWPLQPVNLNTGLVAYYPFNGNANDASGNGNNGTVYGATLTADRFGNANSAYSFNGNGNYIEIPNSNSLNSNSFTINIWINDANLSSCWKAIIAKTDHSNAYNFSYLIGLNPSNNCYNSISNSYCIYNYDLNHSYSEHGFAEGDPSSISNNTWVMITKSISSTGIFKAYINGVLVNTLQLDLYVPCQSYLSTIRIGQWWEGDPQWWTGFMDDLRFYNRTLSQTEIDSLYHVGGWPMQTQQSAVYDIDGNGYDTVNIGTQTWLKQNLKTTHYRNGDAIPNVTDNTAWSNLTTGAYCNYNNDTNIAATYGRLYNWYTVSDTRNLCPTGWHVPTDGEWTTLTNYLGGVSLAGGKLKEAGITHWQSPNTGATNETGFTALPTGYRYPGGAFYNIGYWGYFWTSTEDNTNPTYALNRMLSYSNSNLTSPSNLETIGFSVRCLSDELLAATKTVYDIDGNGYDTVNIGTQSWLKQNLKTTHYRNGDAIPNVTDGNAWAGLTTGAYCNYNNDATIADTYGRLYNFYTVADSRNLCPIGWHVPTDGEWTTLTDYLGGLSIAGGKLREVGTTHWASPNTGATNESNFTALPGAYRLSYGLFTSFTAYGIWWSSSENDQANAWCFVTNIASSHLSRENQLKLMGQSVRCLKDITTQANLNKIYPNNPISQNNNPITPNYPHASAGEPINLATGSYEYSHSDFNIPAVNTALNFTRSYSTMNYYENSALGYGWSHSYDFYLINQQDTLWNVHYGDGHNSYFIPDNNGLGTSHPYYGGTYETLKKDIATGLFKLTFKTGEVYVFDTTGRLSNIADLNGNTTVLNYNNGNLTSINAPGGRTLNLTYTNNLLTTITDPLQRNISYAYDSIGNLTQVTDANAGLTKFSYSAQHLIKFVITPKGDTLVNNSYDSLNRVITQYDALGAITSVAYNTPNAGDATVTLPDNNTNIVHHDSLYRLTTEIDELGYTKLYTYDNNNNRTSITDEKGNVTNKSYDSIGNCLSITKPTNIITQISYNTFNKPVNITEPLNRLNSFSYDSIGNLTQNTLPNNSTKTFTYYSNGLLHTSTDGLGNVTTNNYNTYGDLISITSPSGTKTFAYDSAGRKISQTDENGHTTSYKYNNNDMLTSIIDPMGDSVINVYDVNNNLDTIIDRNGNLTSKIFDAKDRLISIHDATNGITTNVYDKRDNIISTTDAKGNIFQYAYDAKNRLISKTNSLGTFHYAYDPVGNKVSETNSSGNTKTNAYDALNQNISITDELGNTTTYVYDSLGQVKSIQDAMGRTTSYSYNAIGSMISITDAANNITTTNYDTIGNRISITDANNHTQYFQYNASNRLIKYTDAAGNVFNYVYDSVGNLLIENKPTGTITKTYNAGNKPTNVVNSSGDNYAYSYDANGNLLSATNNTGTSTFVYDNRNHLSQYTDMFGNIVNYSYDAVGNKTAIKYPGNDSVRYEYDTDNNLKKVIDWLGNETTYNYDINGRLTSMQYPNGIICSYTYDNAGRLISQFNIKDTIVINQSIFTLDAMGKRMTEQRKGTIPNILPPASFAYSYGQDDRLLSDSITAFTNDASGNRIGQSNTTGTTSYNFSVDNILNSITTPSGTTTFSNDANGNRVKKTKVGIEKRYVLDISGSLSQVLQEQDNNGNVKARYIYGLGLIAKVDSANNIQYYHFDAQHNTVALTNDSAKVTDTYTYDPFGTMLSHVGTTNQPFTFLGEFGVQQEDSSLYYIRARYYDAANDRFLSKDPYPTSINNPQTINRYAYCLNNPISMYDASGLYGNHDVASSNNNSKSNNNDDLLYEVGGKFNEYADYFFDANKLAGYYWLPNSPATSFLGNANSVISWGYHIVNETKIVDQYQKGQISGAEAGLQVFIEYYPDMAEQVGSSLFGPAGGLAAKATASASIAAGNMIGNWFVKTSVGDQFTSWLAKKLY